MMKHGSLPVAGVLKSLLASPRDAEHDSERLAIVLVDHGSRLLGQRRMQFQQPLVVRSNAHDGDPPFKYARTDSIALARQ